MRSAKNSLMVKVCGITRACDAEACVALGVDFCGFVFHPPSPRNMAAADVARIRTEGIRRVGVFTTHDTDDILRTMEAARLDYAQLHAEQREECAEAIGAERVIRVCFALPASPRCAAFLLFDKPFDWRTLKGGTVCQPYFVAGGLSALNVREALSCGSPAGLDLNSGVESAPGLKDASRIRDALDAIADCGRRHGDDGEGRF